MDAALAQTIRENLRTETTEKLLQIWCQNDREEWSEEAFEAVRALLMQRGLTPPPQAVAPVPGTAPKPEGPDFDHVQRIRETLRTQPTEKLLEIWRENDREMWSHEAFLAVRALLVERGVTPPLQTAETDEYSPGPHPGADQENIGTGLGWVCAVMPLIGLLVALLSLNSGRHRRALQAFVLPAATIAWVTLCELLFRIRGIGDALFLALPIGAILVVPFLTLHVLRKL